MSEEMAMALGHVQRADAADEAVRQRILSFCQSHPNALDRSCLEGHLTGSALIVDPDVGETLLIHHAKLDRWLQPGGHADGEGDLARVALREAEEETGLSGLQLIEPAIDLDIHQIPARGPEPAHLHLDVRFLVLARRSDRVTINHESLDAQWIGPNDADGLIGSQELQRLVERGLARALSLA